MRTPQQILAVIATLVAGACASSDAPDPEYAEVAQIVGAGFTSPDRGGELGAFADALSLARDQVPAELQRDAASGLVEGRRGELLHRYFVVCIDATGFAIDPCGPTAERALVLASWSGPLETEAHDGVLRWTGSWTIHEPWRPNAMITGDTWLDYAAGAYRVTDHRDVLLLMRTDYQVVTAGAMTALITVNDPTSESPREIRGDIALTHRTVTITLDETHTTEIDVTPLLIR
jgi:hypothetical protein